MAYDCLGNVVLVGDFQNVDRRVWLKIIWGVQYLMGACLANWNLRQLGDQFCACQVGPLCMSLLRIILIGDEGI